MMLIAAGQSHGPPHILIVGVVAIALVGWLAYKALGRRKHSEDDGSDSDRGREP